MLPYTITANSINVLLDGRMRTIHRGHMNFDVILEQLRRWSKKDNRIAAIDEADVLAKLRNYLDIPAFIAKITEGRVQISDSVVMFDGKEVKGVITQRLLDMLKQGFDVRPLARFLDRVSKNTTITARDEIYLWLESGNLPMTDDGCFLAFKKVADDFSSLHLDKHGRKVFNIPGKPVVMEREDVDTDRDNTCSRGLHFCSWQYLPHYGQGRETKVVAVKIAPEDVVAIPSDYNNSKGRTWRYFVLSEVPEDECQHLFAKQPIVTSFGDYDNTDDDDNDDDDYDDYTEDCGYCVDRSCEECRPEETVVGLNTEEEDPGCPEGAPEVDPEYGCCAAVSGDHHSADDDEVTVIVFKHGRKKFTAEQLKQMVADMGQRSFARKKKIPRTTVQGWLKQIG